MGRSADAAVFYGIAFYSTESGYKLEDGHAIPPAWRTDDSDWESLSLKKVPADVFDNMPAYLKPDLSEIPDDPDDEADWMAENDVELSVLLEALIRKLDFDDVLSVGHHGYLDGFSAPYIYATNQRWTVEQGEICALTELKPLANNRYFQAFDALCDELGLDYSQVSWKLVCQYG